MAQGRGEGGVKAYVFSQKEDGTETIHFSSISNDSREAEKECIDWVKQNCTEFGDHWELNGEWVGITN